MPGSWGRYPVVDQGLVAITDRDAPIPEIPDHALPFGNGRSYGDSCLAPGGTLLHTRGLDRFIAFDTDTGILDCEAGVLLSDIQEVAVRRGWCLPIMPGTLQVTVGGAIANDVHGKNHERMGSFGEHVLDLELVRTDGSRRRCSARENADWFRATVGGLGLTGLITRARIGLRPIPGARIHATTRRFDGLGDFFSLARDASAREYRVAWLDCLARGRSLGRGVFTAADHADGPDAARPRTLHMPLTPPFSLVNGLSARAFNTLYFRRAPARATERAHSLHSFFQPLDRIRSWNRMYGRRGFLQHQCVIPPAHAQPAIEEMLDQVAASRQGSFLVVLKQFGARPAPGLLSFCRPGTTLAMDFPYRGERTLALLDRLDDIVMAAGGGIYPAKDARMSPSTFKASFPNLEAFRSYVDPRLSSGLWRRVNMDS